MNRNRNNNRLEEERYETESGRGIWQWITGTDSENSTPTSEVDSEPFSGSEDSRRNSMNEEVVGRSVDPPIRYRPIIQDTSGRIATTSPEPETIEPRLKQRVQSNAGSTRSARSFSSLSSNSNSVVGDEQQNRNAHSQEKRHRPSTEEDDKIAYFIFHVIVAPDIPDLARLYQWWSQYHRSINIQSLLDTLQKSMNPEQVHMSKLIFYAMQQWDQVQYEGAAGFAPEILGNARNHHDLFHRVRLTSTVLLAEITSYLSSHG